MACDGDPQGISGRAQKKFHQILAIAMDIAPGLGKCLIAAVTTLRPLSPEYPPAIYELTAGKSAC